MALRKHRQANGVISVQTETGKFAGSIAAAHLAPQTAATVVVDAGSVFADIDAPNENDVLIATRDYAALVEHRVDIPVDTALGFEFPGDSDEGLFFVDGEAVIGARADVRRNVMVGDLAGDTDFVSVVLERPDGNAFTRDNAGIISEHRLDFRGKPVFLSPGAFDDHVDAMEALAAASPDDGGHVAYAIHQANENGYASLEDIEHAIVLLEEVVEDIENGYGHVWEPMTAGVARGLLAALLEEAEDQRDEW